MSFESVMFIVSVDVTNARPVKAELIQGGDMYGLPLL
jgi:hypothetical protein